MGLLGFQTDCDGFGHFAPPVKPTRTLRRHDRVGCYYIVHPVGFSNCSAVVFADFGLIPGNFGMLYLAQIAVTRLVLRQSAPRCGRS